MIITIIIIITCYVAKYITVVECLGVVFQKTRNFSRNLCRYEALLEGAVLCCPRVALPIQTLYLTEDQIYTCHTQTPQMLSKMRRYLSSEQHLACGIFQHVRAMLFFSVIFTLYKYIPNFTDPGGLAVWGVGLRPLACWDFGFESRRGHGCLSLVSVVCFQADVSATGWSLVQRSPTECGVSDCDREASIMRRPWFTRGCWAMKNYVSA
jgi:hypothetical protein